MNVVNLTVVSSADVCWLIPPHAPYFFFLFCACEFEIDFDEFGKAFVEGWFLISLLKRINCG
jgi:hypothetical protein